MACVFHYCRRGLHRYAFGNTHLQRNHWCHIVHFIRRCISFGYTNYDTNAFSEPHLLNSSIPCPASYHCFSGVPVLCPAGSYCPLSSINATLCPTGSYSSSGASTCTLCPAGTYSSAAGSVLCQLCPGGHYCPTGTSLWARLNCGRGNYCPDGSSAPTPCPYQVPPTGGWGALKVQGLAFLVDTAHCLNHCFWNFTSGDGMLSKC